MAYRESLVIVARSVVGGRVPPAAIGGSQKSMAKKRQKSQDYRVIRVLISSPDDVSDERAIAAKLIDQLNQVLAHFLGLHLEFVGWETSTHPGFSSEPQAVIDEQIGDDYEIFIGILSTRFGTPTKTAGSGTEQEFLHAYQRYQDNPDEVRIMFYFSEVPIVWANFDLDQLGRVRKFRDELPAKGGLYWTYDSPEEFEEQLRIHLAQLVQEYGKVWGAGKKNFALIDRAAVEREPRSAQAGAPDGGSDDEGFLDLVESGTRHMEIVSDVTHRMTAALDALSQSMRERTAVANRLGTAKTRDDIAKWKLLLDATAKDMMGFVGTMEMEIPIFARSYSAGVTAYGKAAVLLRDFSPEDEQMIGDARSTLSNLKLAVSGSREQMAGFRATVAKLPRASTSFNQARNRLLGVLDHLDREYSRAVDLAAEVELVLANIASVSDA